MKIDGYFFGVAMLAASFGFESGWIMKDESGWRVQDIQHAYGCGMIEGTTGHKPTPASVAPEVFQECTRLRTAGWLKQDFEIAKCFDIYNVRPRDDEGRLPFSKEADEATTACLKQTRN